MQLHDPQGFAAHRERFLQVLQETDAAAILPTGSPPTRNADSEYAFRPGSDFWYLTGFAEPECVLVLVPGREEGQSVLFLRERDRDQEIWTGRRLGTERAPEALGVDQAFPIEELGERLPELLRGSSRLVYRTGEDADRDRMLIDLVAGLRAKVRGGIVAPSEWIDPVECLHELRLRKTDLELDIMRRAAAITAEAHCAAMHAARPGMNEAEIDALVTYTFRRLGASGPAYNNIVAGGENACILHYVENDQPLNEGELLLIDAGSEYKCYASDVTRTFPISGTFSPEQRALYELVLASQKEAIAAVRPGNSFKAGHERAVEVLSAGLVDLGLLKGSVEEVIEQEQYRRFYMHRTGHWLGLDVHDCGSYWEDGASRTLEPGMVLTVEPGLYVAADDEGVEARWRGIGVRIEDDVLVTASGNEVLTQATPKEVSEVEAVCQGASLEPVG